MRELICDTKFCNKRFQGFLSPFSIHTINSIKYLDEAILSIDYAECIMSIFTFLWTLTIQLMQDTHYIVCMNDSIHLKKLV